MKYLKRGVTLFIMLDPTVPKSDHSNEILCILVAPGAAKLQKGKIGGSKKDKKHG